MGTHGMVTSTHYLATVEGLQVLRDGGNAVDAAATMWFCLTVLKPHLCGPAGEVPILLYWADEGKIIAVNGQGPAPKAATIEWFEDHGYPLIPEDGFTPAVVPGAFDAWLKVLEKYGTLSLSRVMEPGIGLARDGFPVYPTLSAFLGTVEKRYKSEWPSSAIIYLPNGYPPKIGQVLRNPDMAKTFKIIAQEENKERKMGRAAGFEAARKYFYEGPLTKTIVDFMHTFKCRDVYGKENFGLLTREDFQEYHARFEKAVTTSYQGLDIHKCGPWCQGSVMLELLNLLEGYDLASMGHNSVDYLHTWIECAKLAYADREQYYADPDFVEVPLDKLLSKGYAEERRKLVDPYKASMLMRPGGVPPIKLQNSREQTELEGDTVHLEAVDDTGNMVSATPSGGWIRTSPVVPGLGFPMGTRAQMFHLDRNHVERLEPGKKPSTTLTPSMVTKAGEPYMVFGTPGGDMQDQWTSQFLLNHVVFDMNIQEALDAPTVHTTHVPGSFWPHAARPGEVNLEPRIGEEIAEGLRERGHKIVYGKPWSHGRCLAIRYDPETGVRYGGASPRTGDPYAMGW
jgi:gamma-glutamyltranspeptidase/glutathione hydrolase